MISFNDIYMQVKSQYPKGSVNKLRKIALDRFKRVKQYDIDKFSMSFSSLYEKIRYCVVRKNERFKVMTGKKGYTKKQIIMRISQILSSEYGLSINEAKKSYPFMKTYGFRKYKEKKYKNKDLPEFECNKVKFGLKYFRNKLTKEEFLKPIGYNHDHGAKEAHRLAVEVLADILRLNGHRIVCNPDFTMQRCDVYDQSINVMFEIQSSDINYKMKRCMPNTVMVPVGGMTNDRNLMYKHIFTLLKGGEKKCI